MHSLSSNSSLIGDFAEVFKESAAAVNIHIEQHKSKTSLTLQDKMLAESSQR